MDQFNFTGQQHDFVFLTPTLAKGGWMLVKLGGYGK